MNTRLYAVVVLAVTTLCTALSAAETTNESLAQVKKAIGEKQAVLVDVREKREWDSGHVAGAVLLPLSELQAKGAAERLAAKLPKDKVIYTHCVVGKRAVTAGTILEQQGYKVRCLKPGYKELINAGFEKAKD